MAAGDPVPGSLYIYAPNKIAPIIFAVAYACSAAGHTWQCYRYKTFRLAGFHPLCAGILAIGYALREYGSFNYLYTRPNLIIFICSQVFIYICPPILELANYHVLARLFHYVPHLSPLPTSHVMRIFGGLMTLVEALNAVGVSLFANPLAAPSRQSTGKSLVFAATGMQVGITVIFFIMAGVFHARCAEAGLTRQNKAVTTTLWTLYGSMVLILVRCVYRLVEKTVVKSGRGRGRGLEELRGLSPMARLKWFFYVFEAGLMLVNSGVWNVWHPGRFLPESRGVHLAVEGREVVVEKGEKVSVRSRVGRTVTFGLLFRDRRKGREFVKLEENMGEARGR